MPPTHTQKETEPVRERENGERKKNNNKKKRKRTKMISNKQATKTSSDLLCAMGLRNEVKPFDRSLVRCSFDHTNYVIYVCMYELNDKG